MNTPLRRRLAFLLRVLGASVLVGWLAGSALGWPVLAGIWTLAIGALTFLAAFLVAPNPFSPWWSVLRGLGWTALALGLTVGGFLLVDGATWFHGDWPSDDGSPRLPVKLAPGVDEHRRLKTFAGPSCDGDTEPCEALPAVRARIRAAFPGLQMETDDRPLYDDDHWDLGYKVGPVVVPGLHVRLYVQASAPVDDEGTPRPLAPYADLAAARKALRRLARSDRVRLAFGDRHVDCLTDAGTEEIGCNLTSDAGTGFLFGHALDVGDCGFTVGSPCLTMPLVHHRSLSEFTRPSAPAAIPPPKPALRQGPKAARLALARTRAAFPGLTVRRTVPDQDDAIDHPPAGIFWIRAGRVTARGVGSSFILDLHVSVTGHGRETQVHIRPFADLGAARQVLRALDARSGAAHLCVVEPGDDPSRPGTPDGIGSWTARCVPAEAGQVGTALLLWKDVDLDVFHQQTLDAGRACRIGGWNCVTISGRGVPEVPRHPAPPPRSASARDDPGPLGSLDSRCGPDTDAWRRLALARVRAAFPGKMVALTEGCRAQGTTRRLWAEVGRFHHGRTDLVLTVDVVVEGSLSAPRVSLSPLSTLAAARALARRVDRSHRFRPRPAKGPRLCVLNSAGIANAPAFAAVYCEPRRVAEAGVTLMRPDVMVKNRCPIDAAVVEASGDKMPEVPKPCAKLRVPGLPGATPASGG